MASTEVDGRSASDQYVEVSFLAWARKFGHRPKWADTHVL